MPTVKTGGLFLKKEEDNMGTIVTLAIIGAVTALAGSIMSSVGDAVSKIAMLEMLWYLIGVLPVMLFQACITIFVMLLDSSFLVNFNFFPVKTGIATIPGIGALLDLWNSYSTVSSGNISQEIINHMQPLTATLDAIAGGLFAVSLLLAVYKMIFAPMTEDKTMHPMKIVLKIFVVGFLLFTWKQFMGVYFRLFQEIINQLGSRVFKTISDTSNMNLENTNWAPFVLVREVVSVFKRGKFDEGDTMYILQAILITSLSLSMFQCLLSYLERYITFIFYTYIGAPFIALAVNDETSDTFKEWLKGILQQTLGITVSMFLIYMAWNFMLGEASSDEMKYMFTIMATICFNLSKNSEKLFNMVGFRTMPTGDLARSFMSGVAGLAAQARMAQPIARAFGNAVGGGFKAVGSAMEVGGKTMTKMALGEAGLGPVDPEAMKSLSNLSMAEKDIMAMDADHQSALTEFNDAEKSLGQAENGFRQTENADNLSAKKDFDNEKQALDSGFNEKMGAINSDYDKLNRINSDYSNGMNQLKERKDGMDEAEYKKETDKLRTDRDNALSDLKEELKGKYGDEVSANPKSILQNAEQKAKSDYDKGLKEASGKYETAKNANAQTRQDAVSSYKKQIGYDDKLNNVRESKANLDNAKANYEQIKQNNPVTSAGLLKNSQHVKTGNRFLDSAANDGIAKKYGRSVEGTDKPVEIAHDKDGNTYALAEVKSTNERGITGTKTVSIPMDGAPELRRGTALYDTDGVQLGLGSGYADGTNSYFDYHETRPGREDELSSYLMDDSKEDLDDYLGGNDRNDASDVTRIETEGDPYTEDIDDEEEWLGDDYEL